MARTARPEKYRDKYRIRWIDADGRRRCSLFDKYADADKALRRIQTETDQVLAGERDRPPPPKTFDDLADYWIEHRLPRQRAQARDLSVIRVHLRPAFGPLLLTAFLAATVGNHLAGWRYRRELVVDYRQGIMI